MIVTVSDCVGARLVVERVRHLNHNVHIVARAATLAQLEELGQHGIYEAVQPEFEAALELIQQALSHLGVGDREIQRFSDQVFRQLYAPMIQRAGDKELLLQLQKTSKMIETEWVLLPEGNALISKTIGELGARSRSGISVVAIIRGEDVLPNPGSEVAFEARDVVGT